MTQISSLQNTDALVRNMHAAEDAVSLSSQRMTQALKGFTREQHHAARASKAFARVLRSSFEDAAIRGKSLSQVIRSLALDLSRVVLRQSLTAAFGSLAGVFPRILGAAHGGVVAQGQMKTFGRGGIVQSPYVFPLGRMGRMGRTTVGMAGEAGPEAILPLARGGDGKLGVHANGAARPVHVTVNITTPDVESFRHSRSQVAALLQRSLNQGMRNL